MALNIWHECDGKNQITTLNEFVWRIVESQDSASTRKLVNSLDEQILLEQMIDEVKPPVSLHCSKLHPLLYTSFRYPPLRHGSRFGRKHEPSLWYGSKSLKTAMAELAFYRLNFIRASEAQLGVVLTQFTAFSTHINAVKAILLTDDPFSNYKEMISSPVDYSAGQELGTVMRDEGVDGFNYFSARDPEVGVNIGVFTPEAFARKLPEANSFQSWQCIADHRVVEFLRTNAIEVQTMNFSIDAFLVNGILPFPAM